MELLSVIESAWSWIGLTPRELIAENDFGNVIVLDSAGVYWRICPEELTCVVIANSTRELDALRSKQKFSTDWAMQNLVAVAKRKNGILGRDYKYFLVTPAVLGGKYEAENIRSAPFHEVLGLAGSMAEQIRDLPDGAKVRLVVKP